MHVASRTVGTPWRLGVIDGDGIGPEVVAATRATVEAAFAAVGTGAVEWVPLAIGHRAIGEFGTSLPSTTLDGLADVDGWILGPHDNASYPAGHRRAPGGVIRKHFGLYANIRPARSFAGVPTVASGADLAIVRENSEGFYSDRNMYTGTGEFAPTADVALSVAVVTRDASVRIAHQAMRLAATRRRRVTVVHKANVLPTTMGLFRDVCYEVARSYPDVSVDDEHVDAAAAHLVRAPGDFDVLVTENLCGDILSDLAAELTGSLGTAPSLNCSDTRAMAQAVHGAAPGIAGRDLADPVAMQLSAAMLLRWLGERDAGSGTTNPVNMSSPATVAADRIEEAIAATFAAGICTPDLGGEASTTTFTDAVHFALQHR